MKTIILLFFTFLFISACKTSPSPIQKEVVEEFGTAAYYQQYTKNIDRLYHMLQGTFVCYFKSDVSASLVPWKVNNGQDSVITYSVPIREPNKDGYWLICYQFMTSLPDNPIYCALQKITPVDRDTFLSEFFNTSSEIKLSNMIKDIKKVSKSIDFSKLTPVDEVITYYRDKITLFKGFSNIYKDHQNQNKTYRQEQYEVHPRNTQFVTRYFKDQKGVSIIDRKSPIAYDTRTSKKVSSMVVLSLH